MKAVKIWAGRVAVYLLLRLRLYYLLSRLWRHTVERKWRSVGTPKFPTKGALFSFLSEAQWRPDPKLLDVFSWPAKAYDDFARTGKLGDCDEFAVCAADALSKLSVEAYILTVTWWSPTLGYGGHNVCAFRDAVGGWKHVGNWNGGYPVVLGHDGRPMHRYEDLARQICGAMGAINLGWAVVTPDLKHLVSYGVLK